MEDAMKPGDPLLQVLARGAVEARERAYAPYSNFRVGAALLTADGRVFQGCNVENASYGLTICAERTAVVSAVAAGVKEFAAIAVAADQARTLSPCGACRQFLVEFNPDMTVVLVGADGELTVTTAGELLPMRFEF
jgi:cytidine deaminase